MTTRRCSACREHKPVADFYSDRSRPGGLSARCKPCDNGRKRQTSARILRNRARQRATQQLITEHAERFRELYEHALEMVKDEAEILACQPEATEHYAGQPVRLKPGRYASGDEAVDRIDVGRCPHCATAHEAGHVCEDCGASPDAQMTATSHLDRAAFLEDVEYLLDTGETYAPTIATRVRMTVEAMTRRLNRYDRADLIVRMDATARPRVGAA